MAELVHDCPRCSAQRITFDVLAHKLIGQRNNWQSIFETFCVCRACHRSTVFVLKLNEYHVREEVEAKGPSGLKGPSIDLFMSVERHIGLADMGVAKSPDHLPPEIAAVFEEGAKCLAVGCPNAAATMFRMCLDLSTRVLLPPEGQADGPNAKQRRDLGLRLPWLFDKGVLPSSLRELAQCIKEDGNDGAHAGTLTEDDALDLLDFTERLLDRLFSEPARLQAAAARRLTRRETGK
jgi:hypothetical protein